MAQVETQAIVVPDRLNTIVSNAHALPDVAHALVEKFSPLFIEAEKLMDEAIACEVTDATHVSKTKDARRVRLAIKEVRVTAEKIARGMKEDALRKGQLIDLVRRELVKAVEPCEAWLEDQEKFAERAEAARMSKLKAERDAALLAIGANPAFHNTAIMPEADWDALLERAQAEYDERVEAERREEEEQHAAAARKADEDARIRADNERLRQEKELADKKLRDAQAAADLERRKAEQERREAESARTQLELQRQAEAAKITRLAREKEEAARRASEEEVATVKRVAEARAIEKKRLADLEVAAQVEKTRLAESAAGELLAVCGLILERGEQQPDGSVIVRLTKDDAVLVRACYAKAGGA